MHYLLASQGHRQRSRSYCMIVTWQRLNCNCGRWSANLCRYVVNVSFFRIASIPSVALDASSGLKAWHGREGCELLLRNLRNRLWVGHKFTKNQQPYKYSTRKYGISGAVLFSVNSWPTHTTFHSALALACLFVTNTNVASCKLCAPTVAGL